MFYKIEVKDHIRVPPRLFGLVVSEAVTTQIKVKYEGYVSKDLGIVIDVCAIKEIKEGIIIPGDGASYYETTFELLAYKPEIQEVVLGRIKDIVDFGAFIQIGPMEGMIHISQTMDDFVSFSKDKVLLGKDSKRSLKPNDLCRARIIAISYKDITNLKLGLTMRQPGLGKLDWTKEDLSQKKSDSREIKEEKSRKE
ncbi:DNA-directed RNA polymerase [Candidatus Woesearchaeota archaeon]|nr:DNA-directed RNA polymerase [Candidatus Woesearchaeota archaeon]